MNPRCSQTQSQGKTNDTHTERESASVATASVCFLNPLGSAFSFSRLSKVSHSISASACVCVCLHHMYIFDAVEQVCSVYSQSDITYVHTHTQSLASRQDRPVCAPKNNTNNSNNRNEYKSLFRLSLSVFPLSSHIQQQRYYCCFCCNCRRRYHQHKIFNAINACGLHCAHKFTNKRTTATTTKPILLIIFLYAYLMLVAYRFMFCLH